MTAESFRVSGALFWGVVCACTIAAPVCAQDPPADADSWTPPRLADGQPDIQGMWNNADANHTPLELPDELSGRESFTQEELRALAQARFDSKIEASQTHTEGTVGFYGLYWWDW